MMEGVLVILLNQVCIIEGCVPGKFQEGQVQAINRCQHAIKGKDSIIIFFLLHIHLAKPVIGITDAEIAMVFDVIGEVFCQPLYSGKRMHTGKIPEADAAVKWNRKRWKTG